MAWIKMRCDLRTHPKVVRIASALDADILRTIGGLHAMWSVFDAHTEDGFLAGYTREIMDAMIGWKGFCAAAEAVGWVEVSDGPAGGLLARNFNEHNGKTAKRRANDAARKTSARQADRLSASHADKKRTREEKRREEKKRPPLPPEGFDEFWSAYPRKDDRAKAERAWRKLSPDATLRAAILADVRARADGPKWREAGGEFIPYAATYLNGHRWKDEGPRLPAAKPDPEIAARYAASQRREDDF